MKIYIIKLPLTKTGIRSTSPNFVPQTGCIVSCSCLELNSEFDQLTTFDSFDFFDWCHLTPLTS